MTNSLVPPSNNPPPHPARGYTQNWLQYVIDPLIVALIAGIILHILKLRSDTKRRLKDAQSVAEQTASNARNIFQQQILIVIEKLRGANEARVFYIHQQSIPDITEWCVKIQDSVPVERRSEFIATRIAYCNMEEKGRANKDGGIWEHEKQYVRAKRDEMIGLLEKLSDFLKKPPSPM